MAQFGSPNRLIKIGRITTAGVITSYSIPNAGDGGPTGIAAGPDGALWFTLPPNKIGRITTAGAITQFRALGRNNMPWYITAGRMGRCGTRHYAVRPSTA